MTAKRKQHGMVLMDLLLGLMIGAIVLAAAATMADAMSHGKRATENMTRTSSYLAQLHTRLADLIMRADSITGDLNDIQLTFNEGLKTIEIYKEEDTDGTSRIVIEEKGKPEPYNKSIYDYKLWDNEKQQNVSVQKNVTIKIVGVNRVVITFDIVDINDNDIVQTYTMTATRRSES